VATNLALDDKLIAEAVRAGNHRTKKDAVTAALLEYVKARRRLGLLDLVGQVEYDPRHDYKAARRHDSRRAGGGGRDGAAGRPRPRNGGK
jgi:Arc/MetJ family transcription regulator